MLNLFLSLSFSLTPFNSLSTLKYIFLHSVYYSFSLSNSVYLSHPFLLLSFISIFFMHCCLSHRWNLTTGGQPYSDTSSYEVSKYSRYWYYLGRQSISIKPKTFCVCLLPDFPCFISI